MNKTELIAELAQRTGQPKKLCAEIVNAFLDTIGDVLAKGEKVNLLGFGSFAVIPVAARDVRNPRTGELTKTKKKNKVKFKAGADLTDKVN